MKEIKILYANVLTLCNSPQVELAGVFSSGILPLCPFTMEENQVIPLR